MSMGAPQVTVVGGGLAGMVAALRLLQRGCRVTLYEADVRLGGKAGAQTSRGGHEDHGYHIFPMWYLNVWELVEELGLRGRFVDRTDFVQLRPGEFPRYRALTNLSSLRFLWGNLTSGILPFFEMVLLYYFGIDLMATPLRKKAFLDQTTVNGFIRSRFYRTNALALQCQDLILKGISTPSYLASAMTMRIVLMSWTRYAEPMCRILDGDMQTAFIDPLAARLRSLGCVIQTSHRLEGLTLQAGRVTQLSFKIVATGEVLEVPVELLLLAIPAERVGALVDESLYLAAPALSELSDLPSSPMAALNVYLKRPIPGLPAAHVNLLDSQFGLCFIDVSQAWSGYPATVLNAIATDFTPLASLPPAVAVEQLMADLRRYLPQLDPDNVERIDFQPHIDAPLLSNQVGIWSSRPKAKSEIPNLFLAGDYCQTHIDLACMEGAVTAGLHAAEAVRAHVGAPDAVRVRVPDLHPRWMWWLGRWLLLPIAALAKLMMLLRGSDARH